MTKKINIKNKGNTFERQVAKILSDKLSLNFERTPSSGAIVGGKNYNKKQNTFDQQSMNVFVGDVFCSNGEIKVAIECKSYKSSDNVQSLINGNSFIQKWYDEIVIDAAKVNKTPVLIFKFNRSKIFIASENLPASIVKMTVGKIKVGLLDEAMELEDFWV